MVHVVSTCTVLLTCLVQEWYMLAEHVPSFNRPAHRRLRPIMVQGYMFPKEKPHAGILREV